MSSSSPHPWPPEVTGTGPAAACPCRRGQPRFRGLRLITQFSTSLATFPNTGKDSICLGLLSGRELGRRQESTLHTIGFGKHWSDPFSARTYLLKADAGKCGLLVQKWCQNYFFLFLNHTVYKISNKHYKASYLRENGLKNFLVTGTTVQRRDEIPR